MKVLLVAPWLYPEGGGLERYVDTLARELVAAGHDVTRVGHATTPVDASDGTIALPPTLRLSNAPLHPRFYATVREQLRRGGFDVVNAHTPVPGAAEMAYLAARRSRTPFVLTYHAGALLSTSPVLLAPARLHARTLERAMIRGADGRVAVSRFVAERVFGDLPSVVASPGVDAARFQPVCERDPGRILFVGPLSRAYSWKGFEVLFEAFLSLARRRADVHLRVVGEGELVPRYHRRARAEGLHARVAFAGRAPDAVLPLEYSRASVVVLPSTTDAESFGMVLAEANACGRPVVASRVGGIPCFVRDGENGLLAEPSDPSSLAARIERILDDDELARRMGERGRDLVLAEHRWKDVAARTVEAYATAATRRVTAASGPAPRRSVP